MPETVDAVGEIAVDDNYYAAGRGALLTYDGTTSTFLVGVLTTDTCTNGQVPKWNTGGTWTCEDDSTGGSVNSFATIDTTNGTDPVADSSADTLVISDGTGITVTGDSTADSVTIAATLGTAIDTGEITDGTITGDDINSNIAGAGLVLTAASPDTLDIGAGNGISVAAGAVAL